MEYIKKNSSYFAWVIALLAMFGSLFFSEVLHFPPCVLCWYQRILMYPLVIVLAVGIIQKTPKLHQFVLPFSFLGIAIALYHYLLYVQVIPESFAPCTTGISCTTEFIEWFGFINIPFLSLIAFIFITILMFLQRKNHE